MAKEKHAHITWTGEDLDLQVTAPNGYSYSMAAPTGGQGATPMEFLLAAAAGCTAMDVISILKKKRQPLKGMELEITGVQAESMPNVFTTATLVYIIKGADVSPTAVERAIELSQTKYCSASIMLKNAGMKLNTEFRIETE